MAKLAELQRTWARGMKTDLSREELPKGSAWNLVNYIPSVIGSSLRKRGGSSHASETLGGNYLTAVAFADYNSGPKLVAFNDSGGGAFVDLATQVGTSLGNVTIPITHPVLHRDLLVVPGPDGATYPRSVNSAGTVALLSGSAPPAIYATVYKDRTVLANVSGIPERIYFGPEGTPADTWDTTAGWIDASFPVQGLFALRNAILVFGNGRTERIIGSIPPPEADDMAKEPLFNIGCIDARTIVGFGDNCIFANQEGVWMSDGSVPENLVETGGILSHWITTMADYTTSWTLAGGVHRGFYVLSIMDGSTFVDALMCDVDGRAWVRVDNLKARMFTRSIGTAEELYYARRDAPRVASISSYFTPSATVINDVDLAPVIATMETPFYMGSPAKKRMKSLYVTGQMSAETTAATVEVGYITDPAATTYTTLVDALDEQSFNRTPLTVRTVGRGFGFKLTQTAGADDLRLDALEADVHEWEQSR